MSDRVRTAPARRLASARPQNRTFRLLTGVGSAAVLLGAQGALGEDLTWAGTTGNRDPWELAGNWSTGVLPTHADVVNIDSGDASVGGPVAADTINLSGGILRAGHDAVVNVSTLNVSGGELRASAGSVETGPPGIYNVSTLLNITGGRLSNTGNINVGAAGTVTQSGGVISGPVIDTPSYTQTGGEMSGTVTTKTYIHSGGVAGGSITTETFELTDSSAETFSRIYASDLFKLAPLNGDVFVAGELNGTADLVKSGEFTVVLANGDSTFTGDVLIEEGILEVWDGALPGMNDITIGDTATLRMWTDQDVILMGSISTSTGSLVKWGNHALTLGGDLDLDVITIEGGRVQLGTGTSANTASFNQAIIWQDATLALAQTPLEGAALVDAYLTGSGGVAKAGAATVTLTNQDNDFGGPVTVEAGTLEVVDSALPDHSAVSVAEDATLLLTIGTNTSFLGNVAATDGSVVKQGDARLTLGGDLDAGELSVNAGELIIGTGSPDSGTRRAGVVNLDARFGLANNTTLVIDDMLNVHADGALNIGIASRVTANGVAMNGGKLKGRGVLEVTGSLVQLDGIMGIDTVTAASYLMSGGQINASHIGFSTLFQLDGAGNVMASAQLAGGAGSAMIQAGGTMGGTVTGVDSYTHSGGNIAGSVTTALYDLTDAAATSLGGTITASDRFDLRPATGTATVDGRLLGTGDLVKSGASTVVLTNAANNFTGTVAVEAGTLDVWDDALPDAVAVDIAAGATLRLTALNDTTFMGKLTGESGALVKQGEATLTLGGDMALGSLAVELGRLNLGNGTDAMTASFNSATIAAGATLYVAPKAALTIRVPNNLVNYGILINDGTIVDDLDNLYYAYNNHNNDADVASNIGTIINTAPGVWTGDVKTNSGTIRNIDGGKWIGDILSNDAGTFETQERWIWNTASIWEGDIMSNAGTIASSGTWTGDVVANTGYVHNAYGGTWTGDVRSNSRYLNNYHGSTWVGDVYDNTGKIGTDATWTGKVLGNRGMIDQTETWTGDVVANNGTIWNHDDGVWTGDVLGNAGLIENVNTWNGDVASNAGAIVNTGTWTGDVAANAGTITHTGIWTGAFTNAGTVNAQNQLNGAFTNGGRLHVTGALTGITVLTNTGIVDLRGGSANQILTVDSASFSAGSFYDVDVASNGATGLLLADSAALAGTVRVTAGAIGTPFDYMTSYTILSATTLTGAFADVTDDFAFLNAQLAQDATSVDLSLVRNDQGFAEAAVSDNQSETAAAVESLGAGNPIYDAILWLTSAQASSAFAELAGEPHTALETASVEAANLVSGLANRRMEQSFDALDDDAAVSSYGEGTLLAASPANDSGFWTQFYGAVGIVAASGASSGVDSSTGGVAIGLDGMLGDWRVGGMLHAGTTGTSVAALNSSSNSTDYGLGVYGGRTWGDTRLSLGATHTQHDIRSTRTVAFPGFTDTLSAQYAAGTTQVFGELSHEFDLGAVSLLPYAGLAYVSHATDAFIESGGPAALTSAASVADATFATLGVGIDRKFVVGDDMLLTANASLGWRHAFAEAATSTHALAGGTSFSVVGAPVIADMVVIGAGLNLDINAANSVDLNYDAQFGGGSQTHALQGTWATKF